MFYPKLEQPCDAQQPCVFRGFEPSGSIHPVIWLIFEVTFLDREGEDAWFGFGESCWSRRFLLFWNSRGRVWRLRVFFECKMKCVSLLVFGSNIYISEDTRKTKRSRGHFSLAVFCGQEIFSIGKTPREAQLLKQNWIVGPALVILTIAILPNFQEISNGRTHGPRTPKKPEYLIARSQLT